MRLQRSSPRRATSANPQPSSIEDRLSELSAQIRDVGETGRTPDLSGLEQRIANLATYVDHDRSATSDTLARLERRLGALADAIENQEDDAAKLLLENLTQKVDSLAIAVESHEDGAAKRLLEGLTRRIDSLAVAVESKGDEDATALLEDLVRQVQAIAQTVANRGDDVAKSLLERLTRKVDSLALAVDGHADPAAKALLESLNRRVESLTAALDTKDDGSAKTLLQGLASRVESLSDAIDAQDVAGTRREMESLGRRLDQLGRQMGEQAEQLSRRQMEPLAGQLGAIEERLAALSSRASDQRGLHTHMEAIVSRLELLKGRSIDPARLNELFDRVDVAIRALPEDRFELLERKLNEVIAPAERFDRLEKKISESNAGPAEERLVALERKLDELVRVFTAGGDLLTQDDLTDLRSDIVALRRELRSLPGQAEATLGDLMRNLVSRLEQVPHEAASIADLEGHMDRIARLLEDSGHAHPALGQIGASLKAIEQQLDETRRLFDNPMPEPPAVASSGAEIESVVGLARSLSEDVTVLKSSTEATERKTRDAIDAVQDTLQAVVKRMAFLERDVDAGLAERRPVKPAIATTPAVSEPKIVLEPPPEPGPEFESGLRPAPDTELESEPPEPIREPSDQPQPSLLSRFTSRQLLRRATGGRAESFTARAGGDRRQLRLSPRAGN